MIHIYFRTSAKKKATARPEWFSYDKCWFNLLETRMKNPITVIHDGIIGTVLNGEINVDEQATIRIVDMLIQQPQKKEEDENDS